MEILERKPTGTATHCCILLHGLGATGADLYPLAPTLWPHLGVHWLFPTAPVRPITINDGMPSNGWYDIIELGSLDNEDAEGINASGAEISQLIATQVAVGIAPENIVLAGFSQGAALTLHVGLREIKPLGALVALSGYLPIADQLASQAPPDTISTPIFLAGGEHDEVIPIRASLAAGQQLTERGHTVTAKVYAMGHEIVPQEIADIADFLAHLYAS